MDSHVLRRIGFELAAQLSGARLETVYRPNSSVFVFKISKPALRPYLIFQSGREAACVFLSLKKPDNPASPDAPTMRLRKYLCGRRIHEIWLDWSRNSLIIGLAPRKNLPGNKTDSLPLEALQTEEGSLFLCLNPKLGPHLDGTLPAEAENLAGGPPPTWEIREALSSLHWPENDLSKPWDKFPYLTPLLRKTLNLLEDEGEQLALLADLESGRGDVFVYTRNSASLPLFSSWPLPSCLRPAGSSELIFESVLEALEECASQPLFTQTTAVAAKSVSQDIKREKKRISRAFAKLEQEQQRLHELTGMQEKALLLQAQLYSLNKHAKLAKLELTGSNGQKELVRLDAQKTVQENMESMFKQAARAARGLPHIDRRRRELQERLEKLEGAEPELSAMSAQALFSANPGSKSKPVPASQAGTPGSTLVSWHPTPSGLTALRGKNAKGNREALKMASPYDIWLHAEGGPSAHVIIKLPHAAYIVAEEDLEMAARLVAEKSWQRNQHRATIICALAKDVHPIKGAPHGTVRVDKIFRTITATLPDG